MAWGKLSLTPRTCPCTPTLSPTMSSRLQRLWQESGQLTLGVLVATSCKAAGCRCAIYPACCAICTGLRPTA